MELGKSHVQAPMFDHGYRFGLLRLFQIVTACAVLAALFRLHITIAAPIVVGAGYLFVITCGVALVVGKRPLRTIASGFVSGGFCAALITLAYVGWAFLAGFLLAPAAWRGLLSVLLLILAGSFIYGAAVGSIVVLYARRGRTLVS